MSDIQKIESPTHAPVMVVTPVVTIRGDANYWFVEYGLKTRRQ